MEPITESVQLEAWRAMMEQARVTVENTPDHPTPNSVTVKFACPHFRIQGHYRTDFARRAVLGFLDSHDASSPPSCTADLRRRYQNVESPHDALEARRTPLAPSAVSSAGVPK